MAELLKQVVIGGRVVKRNKAVSFDYDGLHRFVRVKSANKSRAGNQFINVYDIRGKAIKSFSADKITNLVVH